MNRYGIMALAVAAIAAFAFIAVPASESDAEGNVSISVETVQSEPGAKNVEVDITIDPNGGFFGSDFEINYGQGLTLKELKSGTLMAITPNEDYTINPYFFYAESSAVSDVTSTGVLATLVFDVAGDASGSLLVEIVRTEMFNVAGELISPNLMEGAVVIGSSEIKVTGVDVKPDTLSLEVGKTANLTANVSPDDATNKNVSWRSSDASVATVSSTGVVTAIKEGKANIFATTVDGSFSDICVVTVNAQSIPVTEVTLDKTSITIDVGSTETLTATIKPSDATNKGLAWSSSKPSVATVENGVVTGVSAGTATVTVTTVDGAKTATCTVTVPEKQVPVTGISLNKSSGSIAVGSSDILTATIAPSNASNKGVSWISDNSAVAIVANGVVTGVSAGTAKITATSADGGYTASCEYTVTAPVPVTGVTLNKTSANIAIGSTETLVATVAPADASNKGIAWSSSNTAVATVANGVVTGVSVGTAKITVTTADGNKTATCDVTVEAIAVTGVTLNKTTAKITIGSTETLVATVAPADATNKNVSWSSSNSSVATVANGVVTGVSAGTATITVTTADGNKTATCNVTVEAIAVTEVKLSLHELTIEKGKTQKLTVDVIPSNATNKDVTWSSSDTSVATVSNGTVTGVTVGISTITVTSADGSHTDTCKVTVKESSSSSDNTMLYIGIAIVIIVILLAVLAWMRHSKKF